MWSFLLNRTSPHPNSRKGCWFMRALPRGTTRLHGLGARARVLRNHSLQFCGLRNAHRKLPLVIGSRIIMNLLMKAFATWFTKRSQQEANWGSPPARVSKYTSVSKPFWPTFRGCFLPRKTLPRLSIRFIAIPSSRPLLMRSTANSG